MRQRQVIVTLPNGEETIYNSATECSEKIGIHYTTLSMILNGKRKPLRNGIKYEYGEFSQRRKINKPPKATQPKSTQQRRKYETTKCWECKNSYTNGCSWAKDFIPVKNWVAEETILNKKYSVKSYHVIKCPEFIKG